MRLNVKRIGLYAFLIGAVIICLELTLSLLRQRTIDILVRVENTAASAGSVADEANGSDVGPVILNAGESLVVDVSWIYRIGPRFPTTIIRAEVRDEADQIVSAQEVRIDCSRAGSMQCEGQQPLVLTFGDVMFAGRPGVTDVSINLDATDGSGTAVVWPVGSYALQVTRAYVGVDATELISRPVQVIN